MPMACFAIPEIMNREKRDMCFIDFNGKSLTRRTRAQERARTKHMKWFKAHGLRIEPSAPLGWLEGDAGIFAVYFDGEADPRVAAYSAEFEDATGTSLQPNAYQMRLLPYQSWLDHGGPARLAAYLADINEW